MKLDVGRMRTGVALAGVLLASFLSPAFGAAQHAPSAPNEKTVQECLIIRLPLGTNAQHIARAHGLKVLAHIAGTGLYRCGLPIGADAATAVRRLRKDSRVVSAEPDVMGICVAMQIARSEQFHIAFFDGHSPRGEVSLGSKPYSYSYVGQNAYSQVGFTPGVTGGRGPGVGRGTVVALLDTGATFTHPALQGHYLPGVNYVSMGPPLDVPDGIQNGAVGHGTMVAGIIAMLDPSARILPIRVIDGDGVGAGYAVVEGIYYAIQHGARVINLSLGVYSSIQQSPMSIQQSPLLYKAVMAAEQAGILVVVAAGNQSNNVPECPASYPGVLSVGSLEPYDVLSPFSDYGWVTLYAPGDGITSTYYNGGYATWAGTSFAAPFVTGEASLLLEQQPNCSLNELTYILCGTAKSINAYNPPNFAGHLGYGVIDIEQALRY